MSKVVSLMAGAGSRKECVVVEPHSFFGCCTRSAARMQDQEATEDRSRCSVNQPPLNSFIVFICFHYCKSVRKESRMAVTVKMFDTDVG
jgi:hypothetical protein